MRRTTFRFLLTLSGFTLLILAIVQLGLPEAPSASYRILLFLFLTTAGIFYYLLKTREERPYYFIHIYLLSLSIKLVAYLAFLWVTVAGNRSEALPNVVLFLGVYVLFTAIEIAFLYHRVNH